MANDVSPQLVINYISQRKKILVGRNNQPISQMIKFDYNLTDTFNFQVINKINQIVDLAGKTYEIFGSYIDNKQQLHILFYTDSFRLNDNILSFTVNTYTSEYMAYVKTQREIDLSIVSRSGNDTAMVLRDKALAYPRPYIEGQTPAEIVYRNIMSINVPVSGQFGAGSDLDLASDVQSFAFGEGLVTNDKNQFVIGQYNTPDAEKVFIIGNGEDNYNRSNLFTIDEDGNVSTVGTISANTVYINGQELSATIDDKVNALSGETDDKFTATSAWVNDTFEPIATATEKYNNLTGDIDSLSTAIDQLSLETGNEFNSTSAWINETFETIANVSAKESALNDKIDALSTASDEKFELKTDATSKYNTLTSQISDLNTATNNQFIATSGWANEKFETITNVATKETALNDKIDALSTATDLKFTSTSGWANETFETKTNASQKYDQLSAAIHAVTTGGIADLTENVAAISGDLETVSGAVQTNADNIATISNELDGVEQDVDNISGDVIANKGLIDEVSGIATTNQTDIGTLSTDLETLSGEVQTNTENISTISGKLDDYATIDELSATSGALGEAIGLVDTKADTNKGLIDAVSGDLDTAEANIEYISSFVSGLPDDIALKANQTDVDYISSFVSGLPTDIAAKASQTDLDAVSTTVEGLAETKADLSSVYTKEEVYTYIETDVKIEEATSGKAEQSTVESLSTNLSAAITGVVEDIDYLSSVITGKADSSDIPLSTSQLTNDSGYITLEDVPPGSVYGVSDGLAASGESNNIFYLTAHIPDGAEISGIASAVTESYGYITDAALADYALTTDLQIVSGAVDENTQSIGELNTAVGSKANQTDLEAVSGQIEYVSSVVTGKVDSSTLEDYALKTDLSDYVPTSDIGNYALTSDLQVVSGAVTGLANDVDYLSSVITGKADSSALADYALKTDISDFITAEDIPTYTGVSGIGITKVGDDYEVAITGEVGKTYTAGTGIGLDETNGKHEFYLTGTVLTGGDHISIESNIVSLTGDVGKTYSGTETGGIEVDNTNNTITLSATIPTTVAELSDSSNYALTSDLQVVSGAVTGVVDDINYLSSVITGKADSSELANYVPTSQLDTLATKDELTAYATDEDIEVVSAAVTGVVNDIDYISSIVTGKADSSALADYATTGDVEYLSSVITGKADSSAIPLSTSQLTNDSGYITINDVPPGTLYEAGDGLATSGQNNNIFYLTAAIPTDANISGIASAVVEDLSTTIRSGLASTSDIPTTVAELTDSSDYALTSDLNYISSFVSGLPDQISSKANSSDLANYVPTSELASLATKDELTAYATNEDLDIVSGAVTGVVQDINYISSVVTGKADSSALADYALKSELPVVSTYVQGTGISITSSDTNQYTVAFDNSQLGYITGYNEGTGIKIDNGEVSLTAAIPSKISDLTNDSQFATSAQVSSIITGYGYITQGQISAVSQLINDVGYITNNGATNYTAGSGITIDNGVIKTNLVAGSNVTFSVSDNTVTINATGGGGGGGTYLAGEGLALSTNNTFVLTAHIPTTVVELSDSSDYALKSQVPVYNPGTGIAISSNNTINAKLSATGSISLSTLADNTILISGNNSGGGGGNIPTDTSDLTNGAGFITQSDISNKQRVYEYPSGNLVVPDGNEITYNRAYEIFKTTYLTEAGYTPLLQFHEVNVPNGSLASNEVATFEEWMYLSGVDVPSSEFALYPDLELIGELPATLEAGKTHVFVRRIIYGSSKQYVSYAYSFGGNE